MPEKIVVKPFGGLANRMRSVDSAAILAGIFNIKLNVIWEMSPELNCSFGRLFKPADILDVKEHIVNGFIARIYDHAYRDLSKIGIKFPLGFDKYLLDKDFAEIKKNQSDIVEVFASYRSVFVRTFHQFFMNDKSFEIFRPIDELESQIRKFTNKFTQNTIGIHIRRTDNLNSIKFSPIEEFIKLMYEELNRYPDASFYLATDSSNDESKLKEIFGDRIIIRQKSLSRNSEKGIQDSLVDLYCLSNTKKIIGSFYSSFSDVAAQINHIELKIVYKP
jgi:hypothetical protein